ncbi:hypothetical protein ACFSC6_12060 [Rufibacter sediminis]|uniref:Zinc finger CHC2-type domain-containing protein n=1 Tax=Rufibacter sediminis TaxID=2762756 RepID=A0ABR6VTU4_9BACT|nr:hypothetical protein [Rufibacter sediminis]MBC3540616.1 hypothetical protein [Rufibacter sediminis]
MRIEEAKKIPIQLLAEKLGAVFYKQSRQHELWYCSPLRKENHASFKIDTRENKFKDFGDSRGKGDIIDLYCDYHNRDRRDKDAIQCALKELEYFDNMPTIVNPYEKRPAAYSDTYTIISRGSVIRDKNLKAEAARRNVPLAIISEYMDQVIIKSEKYNKKFAAFGMENRKEGMEWHTFNARTGKTVKGCIGPKDITVFPADPKAEQVTAMLFSSKMDFVTWACLDQRRRDHEYIIYHGDSMTTQAGEHVLGNRKINRAFHFNHVDASASGQMANARLENMLEPLDMFGTMEGFYRGYEDLSARHMANPLRVAPSLPVYHDTAGANLRNQGKPKF